MEERKMSALWMAWKGSGGDQGLWLASCPSGSNTFSQPQPRGQNSPHGPALAVFNNRMFLAWRRADNEQLAWASTPNGQDWDNLHSRVDFNSSQGPALAVF